MAPWIQWDALKGGASDTLFLACSPQYKAGDGPSTAAAQLSGGKIGSISPSSPLYDCCNTYIPPLCLLLHHHQVHLLHAARTLHLSLGVELRVLSLIEPPRNTIESSNSTVMSAADFVVEWASKSAYPGAVGSTDCE